MKVAFRLVLPVCAVALLAACGGTKTADAVPASSGEFDSSTGTWKPLSKSVVPPPHEEGAVIVDQKKPGMMNKVGKTLKKPLEWVGLSKDEPQPAATPAKKAAQ